MITDANQYTVTKTKLHKLEQWLSSKSGRTEVLEVAEISSVKNNADSLRLEMRNFEETQVISKCVFCQEWFPREELNYASACEPCSESVEPD